MPLDEEAKKEVAALVAQSMTPVNETLKTVSKQLEEFPGMAKRHAMDARDEALKRLDEFKAAGVKPPEVKGGDDKYAMLNKEVEALRAENVKAREEKQAAEMHSAINSALNGKKIVSGLESFVVDGIKKNVKVDNGVFMFPIKETINGQSIDKLVPINQGVDYFLKQNSGFVQVENAGGSGAQGGVGYNPSQDYDYETLMDPRNADLLIQYKKEQPLKWAQKSSEALNKLRKR